MADTTQETVGAQSPAGAPPQIAGSAQIAGSTLRGRRADTLRRASQLAVQIKADWREGQSADACAALAAHPELRQAKSVVVDLALEEYVQRTAAGDVPDALQFARRFPTYQNSVLRALAVQRCFGQAGEASKSGSGDIWPKAGDEVLGLQLIDELGRGSFARVFLASEPACGERLVVVKFSRQGAVEAQTLGKLNHENIVPIHYVERVPDSQLSAICMEFLGSATLADVIDHAFAQPSRPRRAKAVLEAIDLVASKSFPPDIDEPEDPVLRRGSYVEGVVDLIRQLAEALAHTHAKGVFHLDLKPTNVLLTPAGRPKLLDFNLSYDPAAMGEQGGTLPYMSPEQLRRGLLGESDRGVIDARSDLFSLGVMCYEMLTGLLPFGPFRWSLSPEKAAADLLERQQEGPQPLRELRAGVSRGLARVVERSLAFDAAVRYQTAEEFAAALLPYSFAAVRSRRRWLATAACTVLFGGAGIAAAFSGREPPGVLLDRVARANYRAGKYQQALDFVTQALELEPENWNFHYLRGRTLQKLTRFDEALQEFEQAPGDLQNDGKVLACKAYCYGKMGADLTAIDFYRQANASGCDSPGLWQNMGWAYFRRKDIENAVKCFRAATLRIPELRAPHEGLAIADLRIAMQDSEHVPLDGLSQAHHALRIGPHTGELLMCAARLATIVGRSRPSEREAALDYLASAVRRGVETKWISSDPILRELSHFPRFQSVCGLDLENPELYKSELQVDPVED